MGSYSSSEDKKNDHSMADDDGDDQWELGITNQRTLGRSGSFKEGEGGFNIDRADVPTFNFTHTFESTLPSSKEQQRQWAAPSTTAFDPFRPPAEPRNLFKSAKKLLFDQPTPSLVARTASRLGEDVDDDFRANDFSPNDEGFAGKIHGNERNGLKHRFFESSSLNSTKDDHEMADDGDQSVRFSNLETGETSHKNTIDHGKFQYFGGGHTL